MRLASEDFLPLTMIRATHLASRRSLSRYRSFTGFRGNAVLLAFRMTQSASRCLVSLFWSPALPSSNAVCNSWVCSSQFPQSGA